MVKHLALLGVCMMLQTALVQSLVVSSPPKQPIQELSLPDRPFVSKVDPTPVGEGGFGKVYLAQTDVPSEGRFGKLFRRVKVRPSEAAAGCDLHKKFAIKKVVVTPSFDSAELKREKLVMETFSGQPGFLEFYDYVESSDHQSSFFLMEAGTHGDLFDLCHKRGAIFYDLLAGKLPKKSVQLLQLFSQVAEGIALMHDNDFIHNDMKLENVILACASGGDGENCEAKIIDFGFTCKSSATESEDLTCIGRQQGTLRYAEPGDSVGTYSDVWSLGIMLYLIIFDKFPYECESRQKCKDLRWQSQYDKGFKRLRRGVTLLEKTNQGKALELKTFIDAFQRMFENPRTTAREIGQNVSQYLKSQTHDGLQTRMFRSSRKPLTDECKPQFPFGFPSPEFYCKSCCTVRAARDIFFRVREQLCIETNDLTAVACIAQFRCSDSCARASLVSEQQQSASKACR